MLRNLNLPLCVCVTSLPPSLLPFLPLFYVSSVRVCVCVCACMCMNAYMQGACTSDCGSQRASTAIIFQVAPTLGFCETVFH